MTDKSYTNCSDFIKCKRKIVSFTDSSSRTEYVYQNSSLDTLSKYRVDGCLIRDNGPKCDYLLLNNTKNILYFVELKGSNLIKAVEQIDRSIDILHKDFKECSVEARIILTRVNTIDLKSTKLIKLESKLRKHNGKLVKQTRKLIEKN